MKRLYNVTVLLQVDDEHRSAVIEKARQLFANRILEVGEKDENCVRQLSREEQFARVDCVASALMDIMSFQPEAINDIIEIVTMIVHEQTPEQVQPIKTTPEPTGRRKRRLQR